MGDDNVAAVQEALVGTCLIERYRIDRVVGRGGFGVVFAGHHLTLDVPIAIKVLHLDYITRSRRQQAFERFRLEAKTLAQLRHVNIARVMDTGVREADGQTPALPWLVMEWCEGPTLAEEMAARSASGGLSRAACWRTMRPIVDAVAHAHEHGVVHRDLKPDNIIMVDGVPRVLDFGIAKLMHEDDSEASATASTQSDMRAFTPAYAAPEQFAGLRTGPWTDVHALALIMTELLTDRRAYGHTSGAELMREALSEIRPTPGAHGIDVGPWEAILAKALHATPTERYQDAGKLLKALEQTAPTLDTVISGEEDTLLADTELAPRLPKPQPSTEEPLAVAPRADDARPTRSRAPWAALGVVATLAAGTMAWWSVRVSQSETPESSAPAPSASSWVPPVVPTYHPYDEFSIPLLRQRLRKDGWTMDQEDALRNAGTVIDQINIKKNDQEGKLLIYRAASSRGLESAWPQLSSGATMRRGASMLHVHLKKTSGEKAEDLSKRADALLKRMAATPPPPLRETPRPVPDSLWEVHDVPTHCDLTAVEGTSSRNVYAVGRHGAVIHLDGTHWTREDTGTHDDLTNLWVRSSEEVFVSTDTGKVLVGGDGSWHAEDVGIDAPIVAVGGHGGRVVAVGLRFAAERNERGWSVVKDPGFDTVAAVFGNDEGIFVVGHLGVVYRSLQPGQYEKVARWPKSHGFEWPVIPQTFAVNLRDAPWVSTAMDDGWQPYDFARSGEDFFVTGGKGKILRVEQGLVPKREASGVSEKLFGMWSADDGTVYAVGVRGAVVRRPGRR